MNNQNIYSVAQVNAYIHRMFSEDFLLKRVMVKGEVSNCKYHSSGHIYFTLKDRNASMAAVMFAGSRRQGLKFPMKDGDQVVVTGSIEVYERDGRYQIYAREITKEGRGDLYEEFLRRKAELAEMGMFDAAYKKPIPKYASRIGVVTAPTGAAIRDIIQIAKRRNPFVEIILYPALVQGEGALASVISGIRTLDAMGLDVLIVGRGGGSIEDLWTFNEEALAREIFACETPVISAVGHEIDYTIADFVADLRAPTPSAAAEQAVFDYRQFQQETEARKQQLEYRMQMRLQDAHYRANQYGQRLTLSSPEHKLKEKRQYSDQLQQRLTAAMNSQLRENRNRLQVLAGRLDGVSPAKKLSQGYAYISNEEGKRIPDLTGVEVGKNLRIRFHDGAAVAEVKEKIEDDIWKK